MRIKEYINIGCTLATLYMFIPATGYIMATWNQLKNVDYEIKSVKMLSDRVKSNLEGKLTEPERYEELMKVYKQKSEMYKQKSEKWEKFAKSTDPFIHNLAEWLSKK